MKIGFDAKRVFHNFTGLGNYSRTLLTNLAEFYPDNAYYLYTPAIRRDFLTEKFIDRPPFKVRTPAASKFLWRSRRMTAQLVDDGITVYHGLSHELPVNISRKGIRSVVTIHDLIFKIYPQTYPWIDRKIYDYKFGKACRQADVVVAISEATKRDIVRFYDIAPEKIKVIYQSCQPEFYEAAAGTPAAVPDLPEDYLLFVGSVERRKNLRLILEAYSHLPRDLWLPLVVVGKWRQDEKELKALIARSGLERYVIPMTGVENIHELIAIYRQARALIYPSMYEGFGLPVAEALLCHTPVITSNVSALPEAAGPAGALLVDPHRPEELAQAIARLLTDEALSRKMAGDGFRYVRDKFSRKGVTGEWMKLYRSLRDKT